MYTIGREDIGNSLCEKLRVVPAVISDDYTDSGELFELSFEIVGKSLCGGGDSIDIHAVGTDAHDPSQPPGSELKIPIEGINELGGVRVIK